MFAIKINNIMNTILDNSEIMGYPQTLIDYYIAEVNLSLEQNASLYGMDKEKLLAAYNITQEDFDADAKIYAETMAKQEITLKAIIESENMDLSEEEFNEKVSQLALESGFSSSEELLKVAGEEEVKEILLYKKVMEFIAEEAIEL
jgi:trigger factor